MIDFNNASFVKMKEDKGLAATVAPPLVWGETIVGSYRAIRDGVVFTNKRIIAVNVQGVTGKKKDFTTLPYSKIQAFSIETSGVFDLDSELELYFSAAGKVKFEFSGKSNIMQIQAIIAASML